MELTNTLLSILIPAVIWDTIWKGIALWKAARKKRYGWFIALLFLNTVGILPIIYLLFVPNQKKKQQKKKKK